MNRRRLSREMPNRPGAMRGGCIQFICFKKMYPLFITPLPPLRGEERFREEGETAQKKIGRREKGSKNKGRREKQQEKGEGRMFFKNVT